MNPAQEKIPVILDREPPELLISDDFSPCPYINGERARMPLRLPVRPLNGVEWDGRLNEGDRRHGAVIYRTQCPECSACEPIRIDIEEFELSRSHRRILRKASSMRVEIGPPLLDESKVQLYEQHITGRGLQNEGHKPMTPARYRNFLVETCCNSFELRGFLDEKLLFLALTDRAEHSLSAHYTFYDPKFSKLSLGSLAILKQIEICQRWGLSYLYLGLYIAGNKSMRYKSRFRPHQRRVGGKWRADSQL